MGTGRGRYFHRKLTLSILICASWLGWCQPITDKLIISGNTVFGKSVDSHPSRATCEVITLPCLSMCASGTPTRKLAQEPMVGADRQAGFTGQRGTIAVDSFQFSLAFCCPQLRHVLKAIGHNFLRVHVSYFIGSLYSIKVKRDFC